MALPHAPAQPAQSRRPAALQGGAAVALATAEMVVLMMAANLPTPLYVIYSQRFGFDQIVLTLAFAVYMAGALAALILLGRLSDQIGRRPVMFASFLMTAASMGLFLATKGTPMLFVARAANGFSVGFGIGAATAWLADLEPKGDRMRAALLAAGANLAGLGLGPLGAGWLSQEEPWPLRLPFALFLVLLAPVALAIWAVAETIKTPKPLNQVSLAPRIGVPEDLRAQFLSPAVTAFVAFALMGFYSAVTPSLLGETLKAKDHLVGGAVVFAFFAAGVLGLVLTARLKSQTAMIAGLALLLPAVALLAAAQGFASAPLLAAATAVGGVSVALGYRGSLQVVNQIAPPDKRAEIVSTYFLSSYVGVSLPTIGVGILSETGGLTLAASVLAVVLCLLAAGAIAAALKWPPKT